MAPKDYVTEDICRLKHEEVERMRENNKAIHEALFKKFDNLNRWVMGLMGAAIINMMLMLLRFMMGK